MGVIVAIGLTRSYGRQRGIIDLDLEVRAGEIFGFLGPNGAGKTTTIRLLLDLIRPDAGTVRVLDLDPRRDGPALRRRVGYLPGELALWEGLTGRELVEHLAHLRGGVPKAAVGGLADRLEIDLDRRVGTLSHGNRQKLGLLQAFMHEPELLILDEPTNGLDPLVQQIFHAMLEEVRAAGRTAFVSSHVLPEVERVCDRVAIVREGRLRVVQSVEELKSRAVRHVELRFGEPVPASILADLPGVQTVVADGTAIRVSVTGSLDALIKTAARFEVVDVITQEATLEDAFLDYFRPEAADAAA